MKRFRASLGLLAALAPVAAWAAWAPSATMKSSTVFVANYSAEGDFVGWGSGFYVDEGIVVTNKHVIEGGDWYRVYATGADDTVNLDCYTKITRSDVKVNLDDDVAYIRVFLPCAHGTMTFADDPADGDRISVMGYPYQGSGSSFLQLTIASGSVTGRTPDGWRLTDVHLDIGNSGGPVVSDTEVVGVAVAKGVDSEGRYVTGYFIPSSVILSGLLYANDSGFGYTPQLRSSSSRASSLSSSSFSYSSQPRASSSSFASSSSSRSSSSSSRRPSPVFSFPDVSASHPANDAILSLHERGVINGYPDGTFRPENGINRAEFIRILVAGFRSSAVRGETGCFRDVRDQWFAPYVCAAKRLGWIGGYPDGTFRPSQAVNRAEAMKILVTAFSGSTASAERLPSDVRRGAWFYPYVAKGVMLGIVNARMLFHPADGLTRADAALWIHGAEGR